jgi:hypothetical protein
VKTYEIQLKRTSYVIYEIRQRQRPWRLLERDGNDKGYADEVESMSA